MLLLVLSLRWKLFISLNSSILFVLWSKPISTCYLSVTVMLSALKIMVPISSWAGWSLLKLLRPLHYTYCHYRKPFRCSLDRVSPYLSLEASPFPRFCKHKSYKLRCYLPHIQYPCGPKSSLSRTTASSTWKVPLFSHPGSCFYVFGAVKR